jgi:Cytochrome P460
MKSVLRIAALTATAVGILGLGVVAFAQTAATAKPIQIAQFTADGKLQKPADLDSWVFLGTSLGMGYNPGSFNAAHPGQFQVVLMEPNAYRHFVQYRSYAPGSMFLLSFYDSDKQQRSINQNGFTQADLTNYEIHVIDPAKGDQGDKGHAFYVFNPNDTQGNPLPAGNACVRCHVDHGAFDGTFAQFYPTLRRTIRPG